VYRLAIAVAPPGTRLDIVGTEASLLAVVVVAAAKVALVVEGAVALVVVGFEFALAASESLLVVVPTRVRAHIQFTASNQILHSKHLLALHVLSIIIIIIPLASCAVVAVVFALLLAAALACVLWRPFALQDAVGVAVVRLAG
jgi:hypothetical protein